MQIIEFLEVCLEADKETFVGHLGPICGMLGRAAADPNPDMKIKAANFASNLALALDKRVGSYFRTTVEGLVGNLQHQHSKVRKATLTGLKDVLACKGAEPMFEGNTMQQLKFTMNDRSQDVRAKFYEVLFHWMQNVEIQYLKTYEPDFVQLLLNGIADTQLDIGPKCIKFLEAHGKRMKEALIALGEEQEGTSTDADGKAEEKVE